MTNADKKLIQSLSPSTVHILLVIAELMQFMHDEQRKYVEELLTKSTNN